MVCNAPFDGEGPVGCPLHPVAKPAGPPLSEQRPLVGRGLSRIGFPARRTIQRNATIVELKFQSRRPFRCCARGDDRIAAAHDGKATPKRLAVAQRLACAVDGGKPVGQPVKPRAVRAVQPLGQGRQVGAVLPCIAVGIAQEALKSGHQPRSAIAQAALLDLYEPVQKTGLDPRAHGCEGRALGRSGHPQRGGKAIGPQVQPLTGGRHQRLGPAERARQVGQTLTTKIEVDAGRAGQAGGLL